MPSIYDGICIAFFKIELTSNQVFFHRALQVGKERVSSYIGMHMRFLSGDKCLDNHVKYEYILREPFILNEINDNMIEDCL